MLKVHKHEKTDEATRRHTSTCKISVTSSGQNAQKMLFKILKINNFTCEKTLGRGINIFNETAKILYRKFETYIPRKGIAQPQSQLLHSCFCVHILLQENRWWTDRGNI